MRTRIFSDFYDHHSREAILPRDSDTGTRNEGASEEDPAARKRAHRIAKLEAERRRLLALEDEQKRKQDLRRKILLGELLLSLMAKDVAWRTSTREQLSRHLSAERDLALFDDTWWETTFGEDDP